MRALVRNEDLAFDVQRLSASRQFVVWIIFMVPRAKAKSGTTCSQARRQSCLTCAASNFSSLVSAMRAASARQIALREAMIGLRSFQLTNARLFLIRCTMHVCTIV
jgi:hypothetical protein